MEETNCKYLKHCGRGRDMNPNISVNSMFRRVRRVQRINGSVLGWLSFDFQKLESFQRVTMPVEQD